MLHRYIGPLGRGAIFGISINALGIICAFGLQIALARLLSLPEYGVFQLLMAWFHILLIPSLLGADLLLLKYNGFFDSPYQRMSHFVLALSRLWMFFASGVLSALIVLILVFFERTSTSTSILVGISFFLFSASRYQSALFQATQRIVLARMPFAVLRPFLILMFSLITSRLLNFDIEVLFLIIVASYLIISAGCWMMQRNIYRSCCSIQLIVRKARATRAVLCLGVTLSMISSIYLLMAELDKVLLGLLSVPEDVAVYSAASSYALFVYFGFNAVNLIASSLIPQAYRQQNAAALQSLLRRIAAVNLVFVVPAFAVVTLFSGYWLSLFGPDFVRAQPVLIILATAFFIDVLSGPGGYFLSITGSHRSGLHILLVGLVANLVLTPGLIMIAGINGAAGGTGLAILIRSIVSWWYIGKKYKVDTSALNLFKR
jgi:O-antigen/teichoic acid export membrane protein